MWIVDCVSVLDFKSNQKYNHKILRVICEPELDIGFAIKS